MQYCSASSKHYARNINDSPQKTFSHLFLQVNGVNGLFFKNQIREYLNIISAIAQTLQEKVSINKHKGNDKYVHARYDKQIHILTPNSCYEISNTYPT